MARQHGFCGRVGYAIVGVGTTFKAQELTTYISAAARNAPAENEGDVL